MSDTQILLLVLPIAIIEIGLLIFALRDLLRPERRVRGESKLIWALIVIVFGLIGPILYFVVGREPE
jgi:Phospholipase_D-nuclease N-terminal